MTPVSIRKAKSLLWQRIARVRTPGCWLLFPGHWENEDLIADGRHTQMQALVVGLN
mgnify:CR=1 FL=1